MNMKLGFARLRIADRDPNWTVLDLEPYVTERVPCDNPIPKIGEVVLPVQIGVERVEIKARVNVLDESHLLDHPDEGFDEEETDPGADDVLDALESDPDLEISDDVLERLKAATISATAPSLVPAIHGVEVEEMVYSTFTYEGSAVTVVVETSEGRFGIGESIEAALQAFSERERHVAIPIYPDILVAAESALRQHQAV